jgi:hypothetical protein
LTIPEIKLTKMNLHVRVVEATDIPKMDFLGKADPYCILKLSSSRKSVKTLVKKNTYNPVWDEVFHFRVNDETRDSLRITMKDEDLTSDDLISSLTIQLCTLQINKVYDSWYNPTPAKGVKKGGKLHLVVHLAQEGVLPFREAPPPNQIGGAFGMAANNLAMLGQNFMQMARNPMMGSIPRPYMQPQPYMQQPGMMQPQPYMQQPGMMQPQPYMQQSGMMQPQPYMQQSGMMMPPPQQPDMMMPPPQQPYMMPPPQQPDIMMPPPQQPYMMPPPQQPDVMQQQPGMVQSQPYMQQPGIMMPPPQQPDMMPNPYL